MSKCKYCQNYFRIVLQNKGYPNVLKHACTVCPDLFNILLPTQHTNEGFPDILECTHWKKRSETHKALKPIIESCDDAPREFEDPETGMKAKV